jgi:hypothetical protein
LRGWGLVRGVAVAAICAATVLLGLAAIASANSWEANGAESSAGGQLGLKPEGQAGGFSQLTQTVATSSGGDELFGFDNNAGLLNGGCQSSAGRGGLGFRRAGGPLRLLGRLPALATPAVIGGGREAVVTLTLDCKQRSILPFGGWLERLRLLTGAVGRRPTTMTVLSSMAEQNRTAIAASPGGDLAVAWLAPHGRFGIDGLGIGTPEPTDLLHLSVGHTSGSMSPPVVFDEDGVGPRVKDAFFTNVRLAWTAHHELLVAYAVNRLVMVQRWRPGHGLSRPQALGMVNARGDIDLTIAVGPDGRAVIAWGTQENTIEPELPWKVLASVRTAAGARFGVAHLLDPGPAGVPAGLYLGPRAAVAAQIAADGYATVAWASEKRGSAPVRVAVVDPSGHFQPVQELAFECDNLTLVDAPGGGTVLQWEVGEGEGRFSLDQATRLSGGDSFAPAQASTSRLGVIDGAELIDSATGG